MFAITLKIQLLVRTKLNVILYSEDMDFAADILPVLPFAQVPQVPLPPSSSSSFVFYSCNCVAVQMTGSQPRGDHTDHENSSNREPPVSEYAPGMSLHSSFGLINVPTLVAMGAQLPIPPPSQTTKVTRVSKKPLQWLANTKGDPFCRRCGLTKGSSSHYGPKYHEKGKRKDTRGFV